MVREWFSMFKPLLCSALVAACALLGGAAARAQSPQTSLEFVKAFGLDANFGRLLRGGAARMQTYRNITCVLGAAPGRQLVEQEMAPITAKYQPQWDRNLADAWGKALTEAEMKSLLAHKRQSPYAAKFRAAGPAVGKAMRVSSSELLTATLSEGMNKAWARASAGGVPASCRG
jgi:hypothetical protein